ncbi:hypothetical protein [Streptomyces shenzhenensis]|uniref:UL36 very large tegument protein n=1 Tax=Streptomyces shenzhenensis TaxID=943815 RepID=A0A3M0HUK4_9ACTN|nr:hypothetical protein [Streptomyces shenzhenensis]RMB80667.1 hypothetical protein CTZ28_38885 [Streptomyces shenzhenensis]
MAVDQLPGTVREFASYLDGLLARLDRRGGWCAVFWQRDPDGMRACLDGREIPPWDVVEALLQDLAAGYGPDTAGAERERARHLYSAALTAYDARPGARDLLGDRLDVMLREQRYAAERQGELGRLLAAATTAEAAHALRHDLAWARDDHERATARCAELRQRMAELDRLDAAGRGRDTHPPRRDADGGVLRIGDDFPPGARGDGAAPGHSASGPAVAGFPGADPDRARRPGGAPAGGRPPGGSGAVGGGGGAGSWGDGVAPGHLVGGPAAAGFPGADADRARRPGGAPADGRRPGGAGAVGSGGAVGSHGVVGSGGASGSVVPDASEGRDATAVGGQGDPGVPSAASSGKQRKRRRGSARFAGMAEDDAGPAPVPPAGPALPATAPAGRRTLRGARFAGAAGAPEPPEPRGEPTDTQAAPAVAGAVRTLERLRREGRTGEAHALLVEAAQWPPARLPLLAAELQRGGLGADWATLLWEAASLPADRLVAAADALVAAGRTGDGRQILRQGVVRPAEEIGTAVLGLTAEGRAREVRALLDAYVRVRTPEEAARSAAADPQRLVPLLLEAARGVSEERHWDLVHALRVAGFAA